jgi:nucleoside-triphosphatase THEP1
MQGHSVADGLLIGIRMNLRAVVIILGFSVLGTELYNPKIRGFFLKTSFKHLPLALELSFQSLPVMISAIPGFKALMKNPVSVIYQIVSRIEYRLDDIKCGLSRRVFLITGAVGQGKTRQLQQIIETLKTQGISVGGVLSPRIMEHGITVGYDVIDIGSGERAEFLREMAGDGPEKIGKYAILPAGLEAGLNALKSARESGCRVVVVDEVGKLELEDRGWAGDLDALVNDSQQTLILAVRDSNTELLQQKWNIRNCTVYNVSEEDPLRICEAIMPRLSPRPSI